MINSTANGTDDMMNDWQAFLPKLKDGLIYPTISVLLLVLLGLGEVGWKLGARIQQMLLVKGTRHHKRILFINLTQMVLMAGLVYSKMVSVDHHLISLYLLLAKLIQVRREALLMDLGGILATLAFIILVPTQTATSVIGTFDAALTALTVSVIPHLLLLLLVVCLPLLLPLICIALLSVTVWYATRMLALLRRRYPEDFDFFVLLSISILAWKILKKETLRHKAVRGLVCSSIQQHVDWEGEELDRVRRWCGGGVRVDDPAYSHASDSAMPILQIGNNTGYFGEVEDLLKPENMSILQFYTELFINYRMMNIISALETGTGCQLHVSHPPRREGIRGALDGFMYQIYVLSSWILPTKYQDYLSVFGYTTTSMDVKCSGGCHQFTNQILLEKVNQD